MACLGIVLEFRWSLYHRVRLQQKVLLAHIPSLGVDGDDWETHLKNPAVHDLMDAVWQFQMGSLTDCLEKTLDT